jgi:hypothetical protein
MQDTVGHLVSIAALATAAHMRYLQGHPSPAAGQPKDNVSDFLHPAHATLTRQAVQSKICRVSQFFSQCHSRVIPVASQADQPQRQPQAPQECQLLSDGSPSPPSRSFPEEVLRISSPPLPSAPQAISMHGCYMPSAVSACVRRQAACILDNLNLSSLASLLNTSPGMPGHKGGEAHAGPQGIPYDSAAVLASSHLCERVGASHRSPVHPTMLACEGIAINSLFDHGTKMRRV